MFEETELTVGITLRLKYFGVTSRKSNGFEFLKLKGWSKAFKLFYFVASPDAVDISTD